MDTVVVAFISFILLELSNLASLNARNAEEANIVNPTKARCNKFIVATRAPAFPEGERN